MAQIMKDSDGLQEYKPGSATTISTSTTSATNGTALTPGEYRVTTDTDVFLKQGRSGIVATTGDRKLLSTNHFYITVTDKSENGTIAAIRSTGTGTVTITPMERISGPRLVT